jgi:hypothetical protein
MWKEKTGLTEQAQPSTEEPLLPLVPLQDYLGHYASERYGLVKIKEQGGALQIELQGRTFPLEPQADGSLLLFGKVALSRAKISGREVLIASTSEGRFLGGEKIAPTPLSAQWRKRLDRYRILNRGRNFVPFKNLRLGYEDGFLLLGMMMRIAIASLNRSLSARR